MSIIDEIKSKSQTINRASETAQPAKAYAWARVSTERQAERDTSIPQQLKEIHEYADRRGLIIAGEFHEATSAFQNGHKRVEFLRMVEMAKSDPTVKAIIVHDFSRFSRDSLDGRKITRDLRKHDVRVFSVTEPDIDPETEAGVFNEAFTYARTEAFSRTLGMHVRKGSKATIHRQDPSTGWYYKLGGKPMWGYKTKLVETGIGKGGRPILKAIWVLDETQVAGQPIWKWARHVLVELAGNGVSCKEMRDFLNDKGIPGRGDRFWSTVSFKDMLTDFGLMKYAGHYAWNVRGKGTKRTEPDNWEIVENAHPAIITDQEAMLILETRRRLRAEHPSMWKSKGSGYLLSGGLFKCARCGRNLVGYANGSGTYYYVCGSEPYRGGRGCGPGVYVPKLLAETEVLDGIRQLAGEFSDPKGFAGMVNAELKRLWEGSSGHDPEARKRIVDIDKRVENIRTRIEEGLNDTDWANTRLSELSSEKAELLSNLEPSTKPIQVDSRKAMQVRNRLDEVLEKGTPEERKLYIEGWLAGVVLHPEERKAIISFRVPDSIVKSGVTASSAPTSHFLNAT
jgi:site-specific DNA recombinase